MREREYADLCLQDAFDGNRESIRGRLRFLEDGELAEIQLAAHDLYAMTGLELHYRTTKAYKPVTEEQ